jgi:hypothetical protein
MYRIRLLETLDRSLADWFGGITIIPLENGQTELVGSFPDQPALRGFLNQIWNMNFTVLSVERVENDHPASLENSPSHGHRMNSK